jgi:hypothetical protein
MCFLSIRFPAISTTRSIASPLRAMAILRQIAAGAFSRPPVHVPSGPKML